MTATSTRRMATSSAVAQDGVAPGYKRTDVGVIPENWDVRSFDSLFHVSGGLPASRDQLGRTGHCYLHYGDIHTGTDAFVDVRARYLDIPKLEIALQQVPRKCLLQDGDVVFVDASEDDAGASRHVVVVNDKNIPFIAGLHTIVAKTKTAALDKVYLRYCFQTRDIKRQFSFYAVGTKVTGISKSNIKKLRLPIPPSSEQRTIAEALSDIDGLLAALAALIAKKRAIRRAATQQLLTGRTRLPGFSGEWDTRKIGEFAECTSGGTPSTLKSEYWGGSIRWMTSGELNFKMVRDVDGRITQKGLEESSARLLPPRCVLIGLAGQGRTRGTVAMNTVELCTNQSVAAVLPNAAFFPEYLYYNLDARYDELRGMSTGEGGRGGLNLEIIRSIRVSFPPRMEQEAIATVLYDMDSEVAELSLRRDKTEAVKMGMMQQLLTGRVRLIKSEQAIAGK